MQDQSRVRVIVGLGNPGPRYVCTRHNAGFWAIDAFAGRHGITESERRKNVVLGMGRVMGRDVVLAKPRTYMNESGQAIAYLKARFGIGPGDLVVLYDDVDLPPGRVRVRPGGSDGGHKGIRSVIRDLGSQQVPRIRLGIGKPPGGDAIAYVLEKPSEEEADLLAAAVGRTVDALDCLLAEGLDETMQRYNI